MAEQANHSVESRSPRAPITMVGMGCCVRSESGFVRPTSQFHSIAKSPHYPPARLAPSPPCSIPGGPSHEDLEFDSDQRSLHQADAFLAVKKLGRSAILQNRQRRRYPMCGLLLVAEHGNRVRDPTDQTSDHNL